MTDTAQDIRAMTKQVSELTVEVKTYAGIVANHVSQQEATNRSVQRQLDDHAKKIEKLDRWQVAKDATLPERVMCAEKADKAFDAMRSEVKANGEKLDGVTRKIAWLLGVGGGVFVVFQLALQVWKATQ